MFTYIFIHVSKHQYRNQLISTTVASIISNSVKDSIQLSQMSPIRLRTINSTYNCSQRNETIHFIHSRKRTTKQVKVQISQRWLLKRRLWFFGTVSKENTAFCSIVSSILLCMDAPTVETDEQTFCLHRYFQCMQKNSDLPGVNVRMQCLSHGIFDARIFTQIQFNCFH